MQVLDHQQQRGQLGQADQQRQHPVEQLHPLEAVPGGGAAPGRWPARAGAGPGWARPRPAGRPPRPRPAGPEVAEGVDEGHVGQADVADLHAAADQHPDAAALGPGGELVEQPGLADAGVAGDQPDGRPPRSARPSRATRRSSSSARPTKLPVVVEVTPGFGAWPPPPTTGTRAGARPLEDPATLHDEGDVGEQPEVVRGSPGTATTSA